MNKKVVFLIIILTFSFVSSLCEKDQIDVNRASLEELDKLYGIGPAKAQAIIDTRPFEKLDDLINVYGIGEATLENIKSQGLACVENEKEVNEKELIEEDIVKVNTSENFSSEDKEIINNNIPEFNELKLISLLENSALPENSKDIKTENNMEIQGSIFSVYTFIAFCVLLTILFIIKRQKQNGFE